MTILRGISYLRVGSTVTRWNLENGRDRNKVLFIPPCIKKLKEEKGKKQTNDLPRKELVRIGLLADMPQCAQGTPHVFKSSSDASYAI